MDVDKASSDTIIQDKAAIRHMEQSPAATACNFRPHWAMHLIHLGKVSLANHQMPT